MPPEFPTRIRVNQRDLELAIAKGCGPMETFFDSSRDHLPFFGNLMSGGEIGNSHHESFSLSHIPGRWLNALLNAEDVLGLDIHEQGVEHLRKWTYRSMEWAGIGFPAMLDIATMRPKRMTDLHNLREVMHALYALTRFRSDDRAHALALELIDTIDKYFDDTTASIDEARYTADTDCTFLHWGGTSRTKSPFPVTLGRYIGPLVKFYRATGEQKALNQAIRLQEACFGHILNEAGDYDLPLFGGHTHSTTAMISSLAQLGTVLRDERIMRRVRAFMENGLRAIALDFGWCIEGYGRTDLVGEINNTADIMETCLLLGQFGYAGYYARAERILRGHLLPAQLLDPCFIPDDPDERHITTYRLASRSVGAFGFPCPYGHEFQPDAPISFNWDIVGGGVGGLCEAYRARAGWSEGLYSLILLFDLEDEWLRVRSPYGNGGVLSLVALRDTLVRVRIPTGSQAERIRCTGSPLYIHGEWLYLGRLHARQSVEIDFALTMRRVEESFRGHSFVIEWNGEELVAMDAPGKRLCYFEPI